MAKLITPPNMACLRGTEYARRAKIQFGWMFPLRTDARCRCGCGKYVMPPRKCWAREECSDNAVLTFRFYRGDTKAIRTLVFNRDAGVCSICGVDTVKAQQDARLNFIETPDWKARRALGEPLPEWLTQTWWEAHHTIPVAEGGARSRLEGYATVCRNCHKTLHPKRRRKVNRGAK